MMNKSQITIIEEKIDYRFRNSALLRQAFTRKSYAQENPGTLYNEVLEYYGDKALEFAVMKELAAHYGQVTENGYVSTVSEGPLTEIKKNLVCKKALSQRMKALGLADFLRMGAGDVKTETHLQESVQEDLLEAIVGAVAMDSGWDAQVISRVTGRMLALSNALAEGADGTENEVERVQQYCQEKFKDLPQYAYAPEKDGFSCALRFPGGEEVFRGTGRSQKAARLEAARAACERIEKTEKTVFIVDEVGEPTLERAINQLQELFQKGLIGEIKYCYQGDVNTYWVCECTVPGYGTTSGLGRNKKIDAKKKAAYNMLCRIIEEKNGK